MVERPRNDISDGVRWRCRRCKTSKSIRDGSFFAMSKVTLQKWLILIFWWTQQYPVTNAARIAEVDEGTAIDVYRWLREICSKKLLPMPMILGGPGIVVQIDESLFRHKPKVINFLIIENTVILKDIIHLHTYSMTHVLQNHRGRSTTTEVWVFGMVDVSHNPGLGYMEIVQRRDAATLLPIIQAHSAPGTIIHSDEWAAYRRVSSLPTVASHSTVNHSLHFVDPATGTHTQNIESYWGRVKRRIKNMKGCHASELPSYLDEFMWRERFGVCFENICQDIATFYPV